MMSTAAVDRDPATDFAKMLERKERSRGFDLGTARMRVANRLLIGVGTFENIVRERVKRIDGRIRDKLRDLLVRELEAEIARLEHELEMVRQSRDNLAAEHFSEIVAYLAKAKAILDRET